MKIFNLALNAIIALAAAIFVAYFGLRNGEGLFASLPDAIVAFFVQNNGLQFVALALLITALLTKVLVMNTLKRRESESRR